MLKSSQFKNMEVINISDNERLGYISDFEICVTDGSVSAIIVPDKTKFFSAKSNYLRIPWGNITGIGKDIVLVNLDKKD